MIWLLIPVIIIALYALVAYNGLIKMRNQVKEAWADIDVQLKRRYNLIPNIVETVKGYSTHEDEVLTKVTEARANAINATNIKEQGAAENMLAGALKSLFAVAENYPDLKANENFLQLQNELVDTEDKIQSARRFYNSIVRDFNTKVQQVPTNIIASVFGFKVEDFFEIEDAEQRENVQVDFKEAKSEPKNTNETEDNNTTGAIEKPMTPTAPGSQLAQEIPKVISDKNTEQQDSKPDKEKEDSSVETPAETPDEAVDTQHAASEEYSDEKDDKLEESDLDKKDVSSTEDTKQENSENQVAEEKPEEKVEDKPETTEEEGKEEEKKSE